MGHLRDIGQFLGDCFKLALGVFVIVGGFAFYAQYIAYAQPIQQIHDENQAVLIERSAPTTTNDADEFQ